jgi:hypothetical protein
VTKQKSNQETYLDECDEAVGAWLGNVPDYKILHAIVFCA